jgi:hypothetical protein
MQEIRLPTICLIASTSRKNRWLRQPEIWVTERLAPMESALWEVCS